jgi:hypothetical protein
LDSGDHCSFTFTTSEFASGAWWPLNGHEALASFEASALLGSATATGTTMASAADCCSGYGVLSRVRETSIGCHCGCVYGESETGIETDDHGPNDVTPVGGWDPAPC